MAATVVLASASLSSAQPATQAPLPPMPRDQMLPPTIRTPQFPLKTKRQVLSDEEIAQARANIAKYPAAKKVADGNIASAEYWMTWSDQALRDVVTSAEVPRAFELGTAGCPEHGKAIHEKGGTYPWIIDPKVPFKVKCPLGGELYPSNDYETYYKSGFKTKIGWDTKYVDDGWGWVNPANGERYWFVAHANHWTQHGRSPSVGQGVLYLARAYALTGDKKYAHKAAVMLHRIAEVYPNMDHERQSRYGLLMAEKGSRYSGGVVNRIWETGLASSYAEAYDLVWDALDSDTELQKLTGKSGEQLRSFMEANLLEQIIDNYYNGRIAGNFGMHQTTLLIAALARQNGDNKKYLADVMDASDTIPTFTGIRYALYNLLFRDGQPYESPGYNEIWLSKMAALAPLLQKMNVGIYQEPRMKRLNDSFLDIIAIGKFTPAIGDTGGVYGSIVGSSTPYRTAYPTYKDERYLQFINHFGALGEAGFKTWADLFLAPLEAKTKLPTGRALLPQPSRLMPGYGVALLNNPADTNAFALYYGYHGSHYHFDRLNLEIFANGQPMTPDLGYPDAMNEFVSGIYTWSNNTIAHNTVVVDASKQPGNKAGVVRAFAEGGFARVTDIDAPGTYPQADTYRRAVTMVDVDGGRSYYVDVFSVAGGKQHDYSLHGPTGKFESVNGQWSAPAKGTLAGENVAQGEIYDDKKLGAPGYKGGFNGYRGSGFQHLINVQTHQSGEVLGQYAHEKDATAQLRIRILPQEGQQVFAADARVSPVRYPQLIKYLIARRTAKAGEEKISSQFVSVLEPFKGQPFVQSAERIPTATGAAILVRREGGTDLILQDNAGTSKTLQALSSRVETDATNAVISFDAAGAATRVFFTGGTFLTINDKRHDAPARLEGKVASLDARNSVVRVALPDNATLPTAEALQALAGRIVQFGSGERVSTHTVVQAALENRELVLTLKDDLLLALLKVTDIKPQSLATDTALSLAPTYTGALVSDAQFQHSFRITTASAKGIQLAAALPKNHAFKKGETAWIVDLSAGDTMSAPSIFSWQR